MMSCMGTIMLVDKHLFKIFVVIRTTGLKFAEKNAFETIHRYYSIQMGHAFQQNLKKMNQTCKYMYAVLNN